MRIFEKRLLVVLAALASSGCVDKVVPVNVKVVRDMCGRNPNPMDGVTHLRIRVLGEDGQVLTINGQPAEVVSEAGSGKAEVPEITAGKKVRLSVAGFNGAPAAGGALVSWGQSKQIEVPATIADPPEPISVNVFLRQVERWSPVVPVDNAATTCTELSTPRAGHTATLLDDGRVLLAGGFEAKDNDPLEWQYKESVEIFDPATGAVSTSSPPMQFNGRPTARAFHSATKLLSGQVLIAGGESSFLGSGTKTMVTLGQAVIFDPTVDGGNGAWISAAMKQKRSRHTASIEKGGRVLMVGGLDWSNASKTVPPQAVDGFEWFDPEQNVFKNNPAKSFKRAGHAALTTVGGQVIGIAGGNNGSKQYDSDAVRFFLFGADGTFDTPTNTLALNPPRSNAAVAPIGDGVFLVMGGHQSLDVTNPANPFSGTDIIHIKPGLSRTEGPSIDLPRGNICAVTLNDGRVLATGGRGKPGTDDVQESMTITTMVLPGDGNDPKTQKADPMADARYFHTCTVLQDGSVLVTGGVAEKGGTFSALKTMEIYTPRPPGE